MTAGLEGYFATELQYLADAGRDFARRHPQEAALLNPDNVRARDPHVERLIENFAFLTGTIRSKLDAELPDLIQSLLGLLAPHYIRPIPSLTTVQLVPDYTQITKATTVPVDSTVRSKPVVLSNGRQTTCTFRTCYEVQLHPLELANVRLVGPVDGRHVLEMAFTLKGAGNWADQGLERVRLFLDGGGSHQLAYSLRYHLLRRVRRVEIGCAGSSVATEGSIAAVGFDRNQRAIPCGRLSFPGFRLLLEYFCFPEKFSYVDICGFSRLQPPKGTKDFTVRVQFDGEAPDWWSLGLTNFRQFCSPVVNVFRERAYPIDFDLRKTHYPIYVEKLAPEAHQVFSVLSVSGRPSGDAAGESKAYPAFTEFRHGKQDGAYYHVVSHEAGTDQYESLLSLVVSEDGEEALSEQVLSIEVESFNGDVPKRLLPGDVCVRGDDVPHLVARVHNLGSPTPVRWPDRGRGTDWQFISHIALNQLGLADGDTVRSLCRLYDWTQDPANGRRVEGLRDVRVKDEPAILVRRGVVLRGMDVTVTLEEKYFTDRGDAYLFAEACEISSRCIRQQTPLFDCEWY